MAREHEGKWFATVGQYRVTPSYDNFEELEEATQNQYLQWSDISKAIGALQDYFDSQLKAINKQINEIQK